ncbi:hypothetical protein KO498_16880 [Lentibacter algarum]|uniref:hypothetical protein n=1 Tax=Lentibacter algarum TaxID=576131 RepID=UPI001C0A346C|nr:hypothetical protein [Lentibacter algarum]MBU2983483.1 hypothetical protein [Lentibacter algarum]
MLRITLFILALPTCLAAQERMSGDAFDAFTRGQTFTYGYSEVPFGAEDYLPDRRVRWSLLDGDCKEGYWYDTPEKLICFVYEDRPDDAHCWAFYVEDGKLRATFESGEGFGTLYQIERKSEPLLCTGPKIGV